MSKAPLVMRAERWGTAIGSGLTPAKQEYLAVVGPVLVAVQAPLMHYSWRPPYLWLWPAVTVCRRA